MKVLIVDDDQLVCASIKTILQADPDIMVVGTGNNGQQAVELYESLCPDILLMDIRMEKMNGLEASELILSRHGDARILFLTTFSDDAYIIRALKMGVKGYILKQKFESIVPALKAVWLGQSVFGDEIITKLPELLRQKEKASFSSYGISDREQTIMIHVADGMSNREIADVLCLSEGTVRNYISVILEKLNLRDRTQLAIFYYKNKESGYRRME